MLVVWSFISVPILQMRKLSFPKAWSQSHLHQDPLGVLVKNTDSQALPPPTLSCSVGLGGPRNLHFHGHCQVVLRHTQV